MFSCQDADERSALVSAANMASDRPDDKPRVQNPERPGKRDMAQAGNLDLPPSVNKNVRPPPRPVFANRALPWLLRRPTVGGGGGRAKQLT